ncbi:MAG: peptide deformylase [Sinobacterium sp.]|nr:peptide deformylase [Sinobacterium sp.]
MSILQILEYPDQRLRTIAKPVTEFDKALHQLIDDMLKTMHEACGIGLAATQVDKHIQLVVMDLSEEKNQPLIFINPSVTVLDDELGSYEEGCLSVPGFHETIKRPSKVEINALDKNGDAFVMEADELLAICIQHEIDHLNGKLFVDYLSKLKRNRIKTKLEKLQRQQG